MTESELLQIDVEGIIRLKNPKLAKRVPRFIIRYLERIIYQAEINEMLKNNRGVIGLDFVEACINYMELKIDVKGFENVPKSGRFVFAANHPLGGLESIVLLKVVSERFSSLVFVVNDILMALKPLAVLFLPVNKHGSQSRESINKINDAYTSDKQILYFPAGLVSRKIKGKIVDLQWQKSFVSKAIESKRDIIPVYIEGQNSRFFYNLARLRKFFRIKSNIEMLYLVDETMKQKGKTIKLTFGEPVSYKTLDKGKNAAEWAAYLRDLTYSLKNSVE